MFTQRLSQALADKQQNFSYRKRYVCQPAGKFVDVNGKQYLNFSGNDYLGIASDHRIKNADLNDLSGSTGSSLINGYHPAHQALEAEIADWLGFEKALLFSTGFSANSSILKTLMTDKNGLILQDKLNHASLIDGGLAAAAKSVRFAHNDMFALEKKLIANLKENNVNKNNASETLIVSEGVFSMDGDSAPLANISSLARQYQAGIMLDDAHGIGVFGKNGRGSLAAQNINPASVDIYMATFGKAIGSSGAVVCGSQTLIDYLVNFSRSYIYSTAMSPLQAKLTSRAIKMVQQDDWRREKLYENIAYFKHLLSCAGFDDTGSNSAIQPVIIGENETTLMVANQLKQSGIWLTAIRPPTVAKGSARLRITLSSAQDKTDLDFLVSQLAQALKLTPQNVNSQIQTQDQSMITNMQNS
ncbi:8-amino-7-oxononanoate synthase [Catenovulum sp. 2E275]|uniref:aminotransferase class I/II-fold pyridoxal phosphate-dependent enzyme n=1 Tax=Catenovulum sp. 2E275 TaxID=2980497 RepID=UPI0021CEA6F6|nr:8-amino-7-oxononanoate synthase [Catenovulum sp. 2E275]MCU4674469.1 8-amino-7-oxononanoate synthase [Catenovulum sp. 2E275]